MILIFHHRCLSNLAASYEASRSRIEPQFFVTMGKGSGGSRGRRGGRRLLWSIEDDQLLDEQAEEEQDYTVAVNEVERVYRYFGSVQHSRVGGALPNEGSVQVCIERDYGERRAGALSYSIAA